MEFTSDLETQAAGLSREEEISPQLDATVSAAVQQPWILLLATLLASTLTAR